MGENSAEATLSFRENVYGEFKRLTPEAKQELEVKSGGEIRFLGGGSSKNAFLNEKSGEVFLFVTDPDNPIILRQVQEQVKFYRQYKDDDDFKRVVTPTVGEILDNRGVVIGMAQKFGGMALNEFKRQGGSISQQRIDELVENYRKVIAKTQRAHGNLVSRQADGFWQTNWDNILVDPASGKITLADYNGRDSAIDFDSQTYRPGDPEYESIRDSDPTRLREALRQFFGYR